MARSTPARKPVHPIKSFFVGEEPMSNALWGMVFFLFSEVMFFAGLIAAYLALREDALIWEPTNGGEVIGAEFRPVLFTILLVASSIPMQYAAFAIRTGRRRALSIASGLVFVIGIAFLINQGLEWKNADFGIGDGAYAATFYLLTGFHGAHVLGGVLFNGLVFLRSLIGQFDAERNTAVEAATMYWHFVGLVWVALFALVFVSI
jgi:cytochrome c oxidase subunit 3